MTRVVVYTGLFILCFGTSVGAERDLIPTLDNQPDICPEQPPEPDWIQNIDVRESYKRLLIQQIYRAESMQRIVDAQSCECTTRYPSWDSAESVFLERYAAAEYWDVVQATSEYRRQANELRKAAMPICKAAGNW